MDTEQQERGAPGRVLPRVIASIPLIAVAILLNALPHAAQSQISSKIVSAPKFSPTAAAPAALPAAPVQVELPPPPPMRYVPGMAEPLVATGEVTEAEGKDLDAALKNFHDAPAKAGPGGDFTDYAKPLLAFMDAHPKSNWNAALFTNLGFGYYHAAYFSRAFTAFEQAWRLGRDAKTPQARLMIDRAVGELARMHARVGHDKELEALFADIGKRPIGGPGTELIQGAHEGLWEFRHNPGEAYLCGPRALKNVLAALKASPKQIQIADEARSGTHGFSLTQLSALADKTRLKYTLVHREPGQPVPVPSIVHWKVNHYAAIVGVRKGYYEILDPTFGSSGGMVPTLKAIDAESDGYFLVPAQTMAANPQNGWRTLDAHSREAKAVYGMGNITNCTPGATYAGGMQNCPMCPEQETQTRATGNQMPAQPNNPTEQMARAYGQAMAVSLAITDTPVGYQPQVGKTSAKTAIFYNQREAMQPANFKFSNLSPKWSYGWMTYVQDNPAAAPDSPARITAGGGGIQYPAGYFDGGAYGTFPPESLDGSVLRRYPLDGNEPVTSYVRVLPDGTQETYNLFDGSTTYPRNVFLTSITDPAGNTTTLNYDSSFRLTSVKDAMGRSTTFTYGLSGFPLLITKITDPFGRTSQINYDTSERLSSITDPIGITSSFTYSTTEPTFVAQMTTPYGTSKFNDTPNPNDPVEPVTRSLTLSDPLGDTNFIYLYQDPSIIPASDPTNTLPAGFSLTNNFLNLRNTYYWSPHAFTLGVTTDGNGNVIGEDFTKARINHWIHEANFVNAFDTPESLKPPLENRTWFNYSGQPNPTNSGTIDFVSAQGRVLDDGTSQISSESYNVLGFPLTQTDPLGRITQYNYDTNNIDLLTVQQKTSASGFTTIATLGSYNTAHEPQTFTGADGQTWHLTYNAVGQIATVTDPNSGVTTWNYDTTGRLSTIQNANLKTQVTYTYDSADRIQTRTDSEGYKLTYAYDNLDRITQITYPDATADIYDYTFQSGPNMGKPSLELRKHTDRLGRITTWAFDAARRLTSVTEPITATTTRTTNYDYYEDGSLKDIIDANGNDTRYTIDIQSRPVSKTYAFGTSSAKTETYAYENTTSRLKSITDAIGQVKTFIYGLDDRITGITYTSAVNPTPNVTFTYDTYFPRLTKMTDGTGITNYSYTSIGTNGALTLSSIAGPYTNSTIGLTYDALGRPATRTIAGGNETFGYDAISRQTSHGTPLGSFTYGYLGQTEQTASQSVTNGTTTVSTSWGYDTNANDRRLISIANSGVTRSYTLSYLNGTAQNPYDIMKVTDTAATGHPWATQSRSYTYDQSDRLLTASATTPGNDTYVYNPLDNATTITTPSGTTSPTYNVLNQLATFGTKTYAYDANGNTLSGDGVKTYKWDAENRLIEIDYVGTSNKSVFSYDGTGHRTVDAETVSGTTATTHYLWCGGSICQTRNASDTVLKRDLPEGEFTVSTGQKLIYMPDQLGSVRDALDGSTGNRLQSYDYTPYGSIARSTGTFPTDYEYARLFYHPASGLNLATYRAQDGITGRFINRDPFKEAAGANHYAYVKVTPTNYADPLGLIITGSSMVLMPQFLAGDIQDLRPILKA